MKTASSLSCHSMFCFTCPPLQSPILNSCRFRQSWLTPKARKNGRIGCGEVVQDLEFLQLEPLWHVQYAQGHQQHDQDRESNRSDCVGDRYTCGNVYELQAHV